MNKNETLKISTSEQDWLISIKSCDRERDGQFIRELTRENFYNSLSKTIGWNEDRYQEEPKFPERYLMLFSGKDLVGFLSLREQPDCLYLETLQLIKHYRGQGIGTALMRFVEDTARRKATAKIQLRVFKDNPAQSLYHRIGFKIVEDQGWCFLMERRI
ncbi:MAG: GNAT family N-acetyltransferase [Xenococcaceae cyanobacterium MO_188.B29]|nr:GNAT family N-acetyltransferase [Xenococcaceae cyanobacterium MO_188.B29]